MTEKFEVGKTYRSCRGGHIVKCLCIASKGNVFLECIKGGQFVNPGDSWIVVNSIIKHYKEYKEPRRKKYALYVFENLRTKETYFEVYHGDDDDDDDDDLFKIGESNNYYKCIDIIEGEWIEKETSSS